MIKSQKPSMLFPNLKAVIAERARRKAIREKPSALRREVIAHSLKGMNAQSIAAHLGVEKDVVQAILRAFKGFLARK